MEAYRLRPLEEKDASGMLEWMQDPKIACFFRFDAAAMTLETCLAFIRSPSEDRHWAIVNGQDEYLGTISLKNIDPEKREAEYAIATRACAHGTGAALAATRQVLTLAFEELHLTRVYLNVLADNIRANKFYQKAGFQLEATEKNALTLRDTPHDLNWYTFPKFHTSR